MRDSAVVYVINYLLWFLPCLFVNLFFTIKDFLSFKFEIDKEAWGTLTPRGFYDLTTKGFSEIERKKKENKENE